MLSRNLKRVLLDSRWPLPPTFLLPWTANLTTAAQPNDANYFPPPSQPRDERRSNQVSFKEPNARLRPQVPSKAAQSTPEADQTVLPPPNSPSAPLALSPSIRELLPLLKAQGSHYITLHIHGKPYLVTQGDTIRLPFLMHSVEPGDVLRMNRAINIGSRDYTMKASAASPKLRSSTMRSIEVVDPTTGSVGSASRVMPSKAPAAMGQEPDTVEVVAATQPGVVHAPHFIPHIEKGKNSYLDERFFVCRAVVMGVESEPMRIMEKTKRRNRKVKKVKSKLRFTVLKVKEVKVKGLEELEVDEVD